MAKITLFQQGPPQQWRLQGISALEGFPLLLSADEVVFAAQTACRLLGEPPPDFGQSLTAERRQAVDATVRAFLRQRGLIIS